MKEIILFLMSFLFIFIIYELLIVNKAKKNVRKKKDNKEPMEVKYLVSKYKFNLKKIDYNKLLHVVALVSSFDMAIIVSVAMLFDSYIVQLLIMLVLVVPVILISYHIVYLVYKKKGLI